MFFLLTIGKVRQRHHPLRRAFLDYLLRIVHYVPTQEIAFRDEQAFQAWLGRQPASQAPWLVLLDPKGKLLTSEQFAEHWGRWRDAGRRQIVMAIGPADGWSAQARERAGFLLSLGPMTLPHELAAVVAAEQVYRVLTILAGHPYHSGH